MRRWSCGLWAARVPRIAVMCVAAVAPWSLRAADDATHAIAMTDARIRLIGRTSSVGGAVAMGYPGAGALMAFRGNALSLRVSSTAEDAALTIVVDHGEPVLVLLHKGEQTVPLVAGAYAGPHTVAVYKRSETWQGLITLRSVAVEGDGSLLEAPALPRRKLLFVGDSVTCGVGVARDAMCRKDPKRPDGDPYHAFGMVLGRRLDAQPQLVCYGGRGVLRDYRGLTIRDGVVNAPEFLDLSIATDEPSTRVSWDTRRWVPDGVLVSLGTNDFNLQRTKPLEERAFVGEYVALVERLRQEYPDAVIWLTEGAIVTDPLLRQYVRTVVRQVRDPHVRWMQATHYAGNGCDGHPTREQHEHMADDLEPVLREGLGW